MPRYRIIPYKPGSASARALAQELGGMRLRLRTSRFRPRPGDVLINWGSQVRLPNLAGARVLNDPENVGLASNKLTFFRRLSGLDLTPQFWTDADSIPDDVFPIVCRTILNGHSGAGIVIAENRDQLVPAPLYVQYIKKQHEYRVHVAGGAVILTQRKARRRDVPDADVNWQIRNHANGFIFAREGVVAPDHAASIAVQAVDALGLDFGAVDVVWNDREQRAYVLEVNTAPGLEGSTIANYAGYFTSLS